MHCNCVAALVVVGWQVYANVLRVALRGKEDGKLTLNITTVAAWLMSQ
ncbi:MAG: hypothetical protein QOH34_2338, partial [Mycobacterium sp.]|nr:hypothetical protein [Mycobacterium sp.]